MISLVILGAPRTKKTSNEVVFSHVPTDKLPSGFCGACRRGSLPIVLPSQNYRDYEVLAVPQLFAQHLATTPERVTCGVCEGRGFVMVGKKRPKSEPCPRCAGARRQAPSIAVPVRVAAVFYRETATGDLLGYEQALADTLQASGILANDRWITRWGEETRMEKSARRPRTELTIEVLAQAQLELGTVAR